MSEILNNENSIEVYNDVLKPAAQATGGLLALVPRAIRAALAPLEKWILEREYNVAEIRKLLEEKLKDVAPENIEAPEPYIAVPAIQYISYCMNDHELRNLYANLLANSMNKFMKNNVHPGYVEIIKQLCPDEAKILKYIAEKSAIPTISLFYGHSQSQTKSLVMDFSNIGELTYCDQPLAFNKYFDNLIRLGLIKSSDLSNSALSDKELYEPLREHDYIKTLMREHNILENDSKLESIEGYIEITDYGRGFCNICLDHHSSFAEKPQYRRHTDTATNEEIDEMIKNIFD